MLLISLIAKRKKIIQIFDAFHIISKITPSPPPRCLLTSRYVWFCCYYLGFSGTLDINNSPYCEYPRMDGCNGIHEVRPCTAQ